MICELSFKVPIILKSFCTESRIEYEIEIRILENFET